MKSILGSILGSIIRIIPEVWTEIDSPAAMLELRSRLNTLKGKTFDYLVYLPKFSTDTVLIGETEVTFTTYRKMQDNDNVEIVLQARIEAAEGVLVKRAQVSADGFGIARNGAIEPLLKKALYDYM